MKKRTIGLYFMVTLLGISALACDATAQTPADAMSSIEWRDCAGYYFYLSRVVAPKGGQNITAEEKRLSYIFNSDGVVAIYAGEEKAATEARNGKRPPLGLSLKDPHNGQLRVDIDSLVSIQAARARAEGQSAYVKRGKAKCDAPVGAFANKWLKSFNSKPH